MTRAVRLLTLMQLLRSHRRPITAQELARQLDVSIRSIYRDIAALQAEGAAIEGEAGSGYRLKQGFNLPPLMFSPHELDALARGARWVMEHEMALAQAASEALSKITTVRPELSELTGAPVYPKRWKGSADDPAVLRRALRDGRKLSLRYTDGNNRVASHVVWPIALGVCEGNRMLAAWCETHGDFQHFRLDRMSDCVMQRTRYPGERAQLLRDWVSGLEIDVEGF